MTARSCILGQSCVEDRAGHEWPVTRPGSLTGAEDRRGSLAGALAGAQHAGFP